MTQLHREALDPVQSEVLAISAEHLRSSRAVLAGGLSLALRFGHRRSRDLDWFVPPEVDLHALATSLTTRKDMVLTTQEPGTIHGQWHGIPFSIIRYRYRLGSELIDDVPLADVRTISGMKLLAALNRGTRRDLIDIAACLSAGIELQTMLAHALQDIPGLTVESLLRALAYHQDADQDPDPAGLEPDGWARAKNRLADAIRHYMAQ